MPFTFDDMLNFAREAWGEFGAATAMQWLAYNKRYFGGVLRPIPIVMTQTQPFGKRLAFCSSGGGWSSGRTITLNTPYRHETLVADNGTLLHEMVHQLLHEREEDQELRDEGASHASAGWRREIMRLHLAITGRSLWAGRSKTARVNGKVIRINEAGADGAVSLTQGEIARWPHGTGIELGDLGWLDEQALQDVRAWIAENTTTALKAAARDAAQAKEDTHMGAARLAAAMREVDQAV